MFFYNVNELESNVAFPTGLCISLNGKNPVNNDIDIPQPIILTLTTSGILSANYICYQQRSISLLKDPVQFPTGNLKELVGTNITTPIKNSEDLSGANPVSADKNLTSKNIFGGMFCSSLFPF